MADSAWRSAIHHAGIDRPFRPTRRHRSDFESSGWAGWPGRVRGRALRCRPASTSPDRRGAFHSCIQAAGSGAIATGRECSRWTTRSRSRFRGELPTVRVRQPCILEGAWRRSPPLKMRCDTDATPSGRLSCSRSRRYLIPAAPRKASTSPGPIATFPMASTFDMLPRLEAQIERFAPGFRDCILSRHVFRCADLETHGRKSRRRRHHGRRRRLAALPLSSNLETVCDAGSAASIFAPRPHRPAAECMACAVTTRHTSLYRDCENQGNCRAARTLPACRKNAKPRSCRSCNAAGSPAAQRSQRRSEWCYGHCGLPAPSCGRSSATRTSP